MAAHRVLPARDDGEAQLLIISGRLIEIFNDNDKMIDA